MGVYLGIYSLCALEVYFALFHAAKDCLQFEKESFGALHQMMNGLSDPEKAAVWEEIENELREFETENGFTGPCEMLVAVGEKPATR